MRLKILFQQVRVYADLTSRPESLNLTADYRNSKTTINNRCL